MKFKDEFELIRELLMMLEEAIDELEDALQTPIKSLENKTLFEKSLEEFERRKKLEEPSELEKLLFPESPSHEEKKQVDNKKWEEDMTAFFKKKYGDDIKVNFIYDDDEEDLEDTYQRLKKQHEEKGKTLKDKWDDFLLSSNPIQETYSNPNIIPFKPRFEEEEYDESAYSFGEVLVYLELGEKYAREEWDEGEYIELDNPEFLLDGVKPCIWKVKTEGLHAAYSAYKPTYEDLFATDWFEVKEDE